MGEAQMLPSMATSRSASLPRSSASNVRALFQAFDSKPSRLDAHHFRC